MEEIDQVLTQMKLGKFPGLDGLSVEFYKALRNNCYRIFRNSFHIVYSMELFQHHGVKLKLP